MAQTVLFIYFGLPQLSIAGGHIFVTAPLKVIFYLMRIQSIWAKISQIVLMWGIATSYKAEKRRSIFLFSGAFV